ncbi:hypothetical protein ACFWMR_07445 [Amycolatopsis thailandensis]|uniref:hypothetical protein n=1 Tax=Amycolatopsis thailandensis TaxID=589330 RepID=UPI00365D0DA5
MLRRTERRWVAVAMLLAGLVLLGAGLLVGWVGLDNADKISSVIGATMGVLGVAGAALGALRARSLRADSTSPSSSAVESAPGAVTMTAEATDDARTYQVGHGDMHIND